VTRNGFLKKRVCYLAQVRRRFCWTRCSVRSLRQSVSRIVSAFHSKAAQRPPQPGTMYVYTNRPVADYTTFIQHRPSADMLCGRPLYRRPFKLKIGTPITPASGNVYANFAYLISLYYILHFCFVFLFLS